LYVSGVTYKFSQTLYVVSIDRMVNSVGSVQKLTISLI